MPLTLDTQLQIAAMRGERLEITPPPALQAIWDRARADGLRVNRLFTLSKPLTYRTRGTYNRRTGDVWLVCDPADEAENQRTLLHELAHAEQPEAAPQMIDDDWDMEGDAWRRAVALAARWGLAGVFPDGWLAERQDHDEAARAWCYAAADLAGCDRPAVARAAWDALWLLAGARGWDEEALEAATHGYHEDDAANAAALQIDRTLLRGGWSIGHASEELALGPLDLGEEARIGAAPWLRHALRRARSGAEVAWETRPWGTAADLPLRRAFIQLDDDSRLPVVIAAVNEALLLTAPDATAHATWHVYGGVGHPGAAPAPLTGLSRVYRLDVRYQGERRDEEPAPLTEVWVLATGRRERARRAEAALQLFVLGWRRCVDVQIAPLSAGLDLRWSQQGGR